MGRLGGSVGGGGGMGKADWHRAITSPRRPLDLSCVAAAVDK